MTTLPYSDIFVDLLVQIHKGIGYCHRQYRKGKIVSEKDEQLNGLFKIFETKYRASGLNKHLTKGLNDSIQKRQNVYPRLSKLIIESYLQAQEIKESSHFKAEIIPSPLNILYYALTVPSEPQTAAYAFVLCRSMLFYFLSLHPRHRDLKEIAPDFESFNEEDVLKSISTFNSHIDVQLRWPDPRINAAQVSSRINYLNGHILSTKGITYLWFKTDQSLSNFCTNFQAQDEILTLKKLYSNDLSQDEKYSFRLTNIYYSLPDPSEVINWIFGVPIPLRGADILFYGGLKKSSNAGLVISIHGQPGAGKTSSALSLSAVLSPLQTKTVYISLEEDPEDLKIRLITLIPDYLKWMSIFENNYYNERKKNNFSGDLGWFTTFKIDKNIDLNELTATLKYLKKDLFSSESIKSEISQSSQLVAIPAPAPLLIVIDNINELFSSNLNQETSYKSVELFIEQCRSMDAIVLLIAADDIPNRFKIDYLVDVAIRLGQDGLEKRYEKPVRTFQLLKTRYQISRQGSHVFHLSNSKGFRISPQVPSQMDKREKIKIQLPSRNEFIHALNFKGWHYEFENYLPIAANSQILIHGHGSSGKAGLGMKLLLMPLLNEEPGNYFKHRRSLENIVMQSYKKNKVLVVSLLYPVEYYTELHGRIIDQFNSNFKWFDSTNSIVVVKSFFPGFLTAEDFVYKIVRLLEEAKLEGEPFTGILLDGLHNVFLQFKSLQEADMIWPLLYSILSRYRLTVVSTFTNFSLGDGQLKPHANSRSLYYAPDDSVLMQQGQKPFLHGLVKAADYYFLLEEVMNNNERHYILVVKSSIRKLPPTQSLSWNREELIFADTFTDLL